MLRQRMTTGRVNTPVAPTQMQRTTIPVRTSTMDPVSREAARMRMPPTTIRRLRTMTVLARSRAVPMRQRATTAHWPWTMTVRVSTTYWDVRTQKQPTTMLRRPLTMAAVNWWPRTTVHSMWTAMVWSAQATCWNSWRPTATPARNRS